LTQSDDGIRVIGFYSKRLNEQQSKWNATELEAFAVKEACLHFQVYLKNGPFTVYTDHAALQWARNSTNLKGKLHRWFVILSEFKFTIVHRKGTANQHVDALSRAPPEHLEPEYHLSSGLGFDPGDEIHLLAADPITKESLVQAQTGMDMSQFKSAFKEHDIWFIKHQGVKRKIVPDSLRPVVMQHFHNDYGHPGTNKTVSLVKDHYWWPNFSADVASFVKICEPCQLVKSRNYPTPGPLMPLPIPASPFERFGVDTVIMGSAAAATKHKCIINFIDHFSRYVWAFPVATNSGPAAVTCLNQIIQSTGRQPKCILSDNGKNYISKEFRVFLRNKNIAYLNSSVYHPQTNGHVEKSNHSVEVRLRIKMIEQPNLKWSSHLPQVVTEINATPHELTGFSPFFLMFGCHPDGSPGTITTSQAWEQAVNKTASNQDRRKMAHDSLHKQLDLDPDDKVLIETAKNHPSLNKLSPCFEGPYDVVKRVGPNAYLIAKIPNDPNPQVINSSRLRKFFTRAASDFSKGGGSETEAPVSPHTPDDTQSDPVPLSPPSPQPPLPITIQPPRQQPIRACKTRK
jgi:hypothetical protein